MKTRIAPIVLFLLLVSGVLWAQGPRHESAMTNRGMRHLDIPDLTETQETEIDAIHKQMQKDVLPLRSSLEVASAELKQMMITEKPDKTAIMKKADDINLIRGKIQKLQIDAQLKIRELLTAEQRTVFDQGILDGRGRFGMRNRPESRRGMHGMRGPLRPVREEKKDLEELDE